MSIRIDWFIDDSFISERLQDPDYVQFHIPEIDEVINFRPCNDEHTCGNCREVFLEFHIQVYCKKFNIEFPHVDYIATNYICDYYS